MCTLEQALFVFLLIFSSSVLSIEHSVPVVFLLFEDISGSAQLTKP